MENSHHLSPTLTCPPSSETAQALEHCWFMSTQRMTRKLPHSFTKEHRRSRGSWPEPDRQRLRQDHAALIPPTVHTNTPFPGPRGFTDPVPQSVVIFSLPTLNLWPGMLSAGGTRGFLGAFIFLFQIQFVFFPPLPFNLFPQIIRKSQDSSRFFCPKDITFTNGPNQDVTYHLILNQYLFTAWITLCGVQGVEHDVIPGMFPYFLVVMLLESHTWNIHHALEKYRVVMSQFTTLPSTQLLKLQNPEIFQNPAFLPSVPLSPTGFLSISWLFCLQGLVWPGSGQALKLHLIPHTPTSCFILGYFMSYCFCISLD